MPTRKLNPFAFPAETDMLFSLLSRIIMLGVLSYTWFTFRAAYVAFVESSDIPIELDLIAVALGILLAGGLRRWARWWAQRERERQAQTTHEESETELVEQMEQYVDSTRRLLPELEQQPVTVVWDDQIDNELNGVAFGFGGKNYLRLFYGMRLAFLKREVFYKFRAVLLHELAHVANGDLDKTMLAVALTRGFIWLVPLFLAWFTLQQVQNTFTLVYVGFVMRSIGLLLIVRLARRAILRIREHYADARASAWLGGGETLTAVLEDEGLPTAPVDQRWAALWKIEERLMRAHPTLAERKRMITDPRELFRPHWVTNFLSGVLVGLAGSASVMFLIIYTNFFSPLVLELRGDSRAFNILIIALFTIGFASILVYFILWPLVSTTGIQIQKASFANHMHPEQIRLLTWRELCQQLAIVSVGVLIGREIWFLESAQVADLLVMPIDFLFWFITLLLWAIPLYSLSGRIYATLQQDSLRIRKMRRINIISVITAIWFILMAQLIPEALREDGISMTIEAISSLLLPITGLFLKVAIIPVIISAVLWAFLWFPSRNEADTEQPGPWAWLDASPAPSPPIPTIQTYLDEPPPLNL